MAQELPDSLVVSTEATAVVLVDMQPEFVNHLAAETEDGLVRAQIEVILECAKKDIPLLVLEYKDFGSTIPALAREVQRVPRTTIVPKKRNNGFTNPNLAEKLGKLNVRNLIFMGINASCCVLETAKSAKNLGYTIFTAENLIANCPCSSPREEWYARNGHSAATLVLR